ncbi:uncharacterized protein N7483_012740 [Penicillium malachiteum]|uniref:uncharacterized protein n=1 Tax=Penicillium malachiteum TaxID=1324776 RepID=UPI00254873FD|nr:uncharacterized protein N7483_012740 [Penicillium malachiteum]KAJ5715559.1 hypothetical protein N7483_012740 [Penicillium malachiteum]
MSYVTALATAVDKNVVTNTITYTNYITTTETIKPTSTVIGGTSTVVEPNPTTVIITSVDTMTIESVATDTVIDVTSNTVTATVTAEATYSDFAKRDVVVPTELDFFEPSILTAACLELGVTGSTTEIVQTAYVTDTASPATVTTDITGAVTTTLLATVMTEDAATETTTQTAFTTINDVVTTIVTNTIDVTSVLSVTSTAVVTVTATPSTLYTVRTSKNYVTSTSYVTVTSDVTVTQTETVSGTTTDFPTTTCNAVRNPDFDNSLGGLTVTTTGSGTTAFVAGDSTTYALQASIASGEAETVTISQTIDVEAGREYYFSQYLRSSDGVSTQFYVIESGSTTHTYAASALATGWSHYRWVFTPTTSSVTLTLKLTSTASSAKTWAIDLDRVFIFPWSSYSPCESSI